MIKKLVCICLLLMIVAMPAHAFLYDLPVLEKSEISKLKDEELVDKYIDVLVEMEASKTFHQNSGFSPEGYKKYKALIKYRILLSIEVQKRELEIRDQIKGAY